GLLALPGYKTSYNDANYIPKNIPANQGLTAAQRHFPQSSMATPDILFVESDHDMRNPADFLILNKLAKGIFAVPGVASVQAPTRPAGTPIEHTSIPFMLSMQNASQVQNLEFQKARMNDLLKQAEEMQETINLMQRMYGLMQQLNAATHSTVIKTKEMQAITDELRDHVADFDDFWRPIRNYFNWEPHCFNIPICWSLRSIWDSIDSIDAISDKFHDLTKDLDQLDALLPQLLNQFPPMIATMQSMKTMMLTMHSTMSGVFGQM